MQRVCQSERRVGWDSKNKLVGTKSVNLCSVFLALIAHASAISKLQCVL